MTSVAILGAGRLGTVLARLAVAGGYEVRIAGSEDPKFIALTVQTYARGAVPLAARDAIDGADLVVLALPLHRFTELPADALAGHIVVDAMNHWLEVDGPMPEFTDAPEGTSSVVASRLPGAQVVKALGHVGYLDLDAHGRDGRRVALGIATDHPGAADAVARFIDAMGFDPVIVGPLASGVALQPGSLAFGAAMTRADLERAVSDVPRAPEIP